jgi:hypothetical protein
LILYLGYCESCSELGSADISSIFISLLLEICPEVGLLNHRVVLYLNFLGTAMPFFIVADSFKFPPAI